jgi:c(7)-type cytochrome triheme protein
MKRRFLLVVAVIFVLVTIAAAVDNGPATINLREAWSVEAVKQKGKDVVFDHAFHQTNNECTECHETAAGGKWKPQGEIKEMNEKNAAHKYCWDCHTKKDVKQVKKVCTKCHVVAKK